MKKKKYKSFGNILRIKCFLLFCLFIVHSAKPQPYPVDSARMAEQAKFEEQARLGIAPAVSTRPANPNAGSIWVDREAPYSTYTPEEMVREVFIKSGGGSCATEGFVSNITFTGLSWNGTAWTTNTNGRALSYFSHGTEDGLGLESGLLLTTGGGLLVEGPNSSGNASGLGGGTSISDSDLQGLIPNYKIDSGSILEFDFVPQQSEISFEYIFASEEYSYYANSNYNDVFGFFISGNEYTQPTNIALLPGTSIPVAINNVNNGKLSNSSNQSSASDYPGTNPQNPEYFVPNYTSPPGTYMEYNGRTVVLTAKATVQPGKTYHLKLAVANVQDNAYGSGVFLKAGSFDIGLGMTNFGNGIEGMDNVFQSCDNNKFTLKINARSTATTVNMSYSGTAVNDLCQLDGTALPSTITFPANTTDMEVVYKVKDNVTVNGGSFTISAEIPDCGDPITKTIYVYSRFNGATATTTPTCSNDGSITMTASGGTGFYQASMDGINWQSVKIPFTGLESNTYTVYVRDSISCYVEPLTVVVPGRVDKPVISPSGINYIHSYETLLLTSTASTVYQWYKDGTAIAGATGQTYEVIEEGTYTIQVTNEYGCISGLSDPVIVMYYPDNISEADCFIEPPVTNWQPQLKARSNTNVHILAQPFVGDVDGDGKSEVVTTNQIGTSGYTYSDQVLIFDNDLELKYTINTPQMCTNSATPIVLLRLKPDDKDALIIIATHSADNYRLRAYKPDGTHVWTSSSSYYINSSAVSNASVCLVAGDINNDGIPEILAVDGIFNAETGQLIATLSAGGGRGYRTLNGGNPTYMPALADVDNDGRLEVVTGNTTYKVNITDPDDASKNSVSVLAQASGLADGFVSVADIDLDGRLDVVTVIHGSSPSMAVWNGATGDFIAGPITASASGAGGSRAFIGDVDNDGYPEIFYSYANRLVAYDYVPSGATPAARLVQKWMVTTSDGSGGTTLSMFDFDQDGKAELVYRDETHLRIIDGNTGANRETIECHSATHSEYPIVVDFDGDGHADILVSGASTTATQGNDVRIYWFSGVNNDWAPARKVWNQHGYNSVHVNEDLTIPRFQFNPSTVFTGKDGLQTLRPYNGYLMQQTALSKDGEPLFLTPEAVVRDAEEIRFHYDNLTDTLVITKLYVGNDGDALLQAPVMITAYKNEISQVSMKYVYPHPVAVPVGGTEEVSFSIPDFSSWLPVEKLVIRVNDAGTGYNYQAVCDSCCNNNEEGYFANLPLDSLAWADSYRKCEGESVLFTSLQLPGMDVKLNWLTPAGVSFGTLQTATIAGLTPAHIGRYIFEARAINENLSVRYTIPHLSVAPALMYWRQDAKDSNWNNIHNWARSATLNDTILAVPGSCTEVHIPGITTYYPSLNPEVTDYSLYEDPTVNHIVYHYGAQTAWPHKLYYNRASVQYNFGYYNGTGLTPGAQPPVNSDNGISQVLSRNSWHPLSSPLKKTATGDFSLAGYPFTWQQLYNSYHPETGNLIMGDFTGTFSSNAIDLAETNHAIAVKIAAFGNETGYSDHANLEGLQGIIQLPYYDNVALSQYHTGHYYNSLMKQSNFYYYDTSTLLQSVQSPGTLRRGEESYRFVFEDDSNSAGTVTINSKTVPGYTLNVSISNETDRSIMIGNPFTAAINSRLFYEANSAVLDENAGYYTFNPSTEMWQANAYAATNSILPQAAILIVLRNGVDTASLLFPLEGDYALTGTDGMSGFLAPLSLGASLEISIRNASQDSPLGDAAILYRPDSENDNEAYTNVSKLVYTDSHSVGEVFIISEDNSSNRKQLFQGNASEIGLGIRSSAYDEELVLEFENVSAFASSASVKAILVDKLTATEQDLTVNPVYRFIRKASENETLYSDVERFKLRFESQLNGNSTGTDWMGTGYITINYVSNILNVTSSGILTNVEIYDLRGYTLHSSQTLSANQTVYNVTIDLPAGVYIVKVHTENGKTEIKKLTIK